MSNTDGVSWVYDIQDKVFSIIKANGTSRLKSKYPSIRFTTSDKNTGSSATFPTVYMKELPAIEDGKDLVGEDVNCVLYTMQIDVYTNTSQQDAREVARVITVLFKKLKFEITSFPEFFNGDSVYRSTFRVSRRIGQGDDIVN